jgi:alpha-glucosidase
MRVSSRPAAGEPVNIAPSLLGGWLRHLRPRRRERVRDRIDALARGFRLIGWRNSLRACRYAWSRGRLEREVRPVTTPTRAPGRLTSVERIPGGARFWFTVAGPAVTGQPHLSLEVRFLARGGVFIGWDGAAPTPSYALGVFGAVPGGAMPEDAELDGAADQRAASPTDPAPDSELARDGDGWSVRVPGLVVSVDQEGGLAFRTEPGPHGEETRTLRLDRPPRWEGTTWVHRSVLDSDAAVLGLGGRSAPLDRRGGTYRLWNSDPGGTYAAGDDPLSLSIPVYLVVADAGAHLAFYDNTHDGTVEVADEVTVQMVDGPLRYYVFPGTPAQALERYTGLTGRPALPPRWALGYHQCRWGYGSQAVVREIADRFAEHDLPLSGIWLDIDHLVNNRPFAVDDTRYPDLAGLTAELARRDVHVVAIVDPGVAKDRGDPVYRSGRAIDAFCRGPDGRVVSGVVWPGTTVFPDFTAPRVRRWWGELYEGYVKLGVDGFWHDMNEPSVFAAWGDGTLPRLTRHELDGRGGDHREAHNVYALLLNHAAFEAVRRLRPDRRPFLLSRSGFAGLQRYAGTWSGDIGTSWAGLRTSLAFTLGLGCSGVPFSGPDIGGFDAHPSDELYVRWFQLAAYLPFFRVHCAARLPQREPWAFGPTVLELVRPSLRERYELLPYWYTLAFEAHRTGAPYVRPMVWIDPADAGLRWEDDQFLLGDALLVAPVLEEGARERTVRLPRGRWYDRRTGVAYEGPEYVTVPAPLDVTPVLVRAGAVVPVERGGRIELDAYPPDEEPALGGRLITDGGDGYGAPAEERFGIGRDARGRWVIEYDGPADTLPYPVRWCGSP